MDKLSGGLIAGIIIIILAIAAVTMIFTSYRPSSSNNNVSSISGPSSVSMPILLTDPPQVPAGTTALAINYSSIAVQARNASGAGWYSGSGTGSIDLLSVLNLSQTIGAANVPLNSTITQVRFNVSSASITINGTTYPVTVPNSTVMVHLNGNAKASGSTGALLDLSPVVAAIYSANATTFVMVPSARAVIVESNSSINTTGSRHNITKKERTELEHARANISISTASLSYANGTLHLSVSVRNNGNSSVVLRHLMINGNTSASLENESESESGHSGDNHNASNNLTGNEGDNHPRIPSSYNESDLNNFLNASFRGREHVNFSDINSQLNGSLNGLGANASLYSHAYANARVGLEVEHFRVLNFLLSQNGTLTLPSSEGEFENAGYTLAANSTATFNFTGNVTVGEGHVFVALTPGNTYDIFVGGEQGGRATMNVTAS